MGCISSICESVETNPFHQDFVLGPELGKGHFATVHLCTRKTTGEKCAVKIIYKKRMSNPSYMRDEVDILSKIGAHRHCVELFEVYENSTSFFLVMELCTGGDLFSRISEHGSYTEKEASRCLRQLGSAIYHIHSKGITHRDLKPENILLASPSKKADIKVADFGLSKVIEQKTDVMKTICGTWAYCAPEVIRQEEYGPEVDNWTIGVLMYILMSGYHPFDEYGDLSEPDLLEKIIDCDYNFDDPVWEDVSEAPKDIIRKLLQSDPADRMTLKEFCSHPWIRGETAQERALSSTIERMQSFNENRKRGSALSRKSSQSVSILPSRNSIEEEQKPYNAPSIVAEEEEESYEDSSNSSTKGNSPVFPVMESSTKDKSNTSNTSTLGGKPSSLVVEPIVDAGVHCN